jgi:hypothetical protein
MQPAPGDDRTDENQDDQDRVVSRRVDHRTTAGPDDQSAYQAANPDTGDGSSGPQDSPARAEPDAGSTTQSAADEVSEADESEPDRSE